MAMSLDEILKQLGQAAPSDMNPAAFNAQMSTPADDMSALQSELQQATPTFANQMLKGSSPVIPTGGPDKVPDPLQDMYSMIDSNKSQAGVPLDVYDKQPPMVPPSQPEQPANLMTQENIQKVLGNRAVSPVSPSEQPEQMSGKLPELPQDNQNDLIQRLLKAQGENKDSMLNAAIMDAASKFAAGNLGVGGQTKLEALDSGANFQRAMGKQGVEDILQEQKAVSDDITQQGKAIGLDDEKKMRDPQSDISSKFREALVSAMPELKGQDLVNNASAEQLNQIFPFLKTKLETDYRKAQLAKSDSKEDRMSMMLEQRQKEEARRERMGQINTARNFIKDDPRFKPIMEQIPEFESIDKLITQIENGNETALAALGTKMAKAMGEKGMLTDQDVTRYVKSQSWGRQLLDWGDKGAKGQLPKKTLDDIKSNIKMFKGELRNNVDTIYGDAEKRMNTAFPEADKEFVAGILGKPTLSQDSSGQTQQSSDTMVKMLDPNGDPRMVPRNKVDAAIKAGGKLAE